MSLSKNLHPNQLFLRYFSKNIKLDNILYISLLEPPKRPTTILWVSLFCKHDKFSSFLQPLPIVIVDPTRREQLNQANDLWKANKTLNCWRKQLDEHFPSHFPTFIESWLVNHCVLLLDSRTHCSISPISVKLSVMSYKKRIWFV